MSSLSVLDDVITINGPDLSTYASKTLVDSKQATLQADSSGNRILNGTIVRSLMAERNITLENVGEAIKIKGPDLTTYATTAALQGKQTALSANSTGIPIMREATIRSLAAGTNMSSLSVQEDVITINGPDLSTYASKASPVFTGRATAENLSVTNYIDTSGNEVITYKPLRCTQGVRPSATELFNTLHTLTSEVLGGLVLCKVSNQTITVMSPIDFTGASFEIIVPTTGTTLLTLPTGVTFSACRQWF